jgi:DNA processing protein
MARVPGGIAGAAAGAAGLPPEAFAAALTCLPGMGPARLSAILRAETAELAWGHVCDGRPWHDSDVLEALGSRADALTSGWRRVASELDPAVVWQAIVDRAIGVAVIGSAGYPPVLAADIEPPGVVFHQGSPDVVAGARVAVVGTRQCSATGAAIAWELGRNLATAGVAVVSGLASGIDAAGHRGALSADADGGGGAPPIGVVGSGLDVVYPRSQAALWRAVASNGLLLSEAPLGARPERWRFPARNRIIAALADLVVVVESHRTGGSMHTVDEADRRGIDVMAVPGSVRAPASAGTNGLLAEGRAPACSADDVLVALGLGPASRRSRRETRAGPDPADGPVLDALGWQPATLDQIGVRTGHQLAVLAPALDRLCEAGWVARRGGWYERVAGGTP